MGDGVLQSCLVPGNVLMPHTSPLFYFTMCRDFILLCIYNIYNICTFVSLYTEHLEHDIPSRGKKYYPILTFKGKIS